jgi:phage tail sheath protein FI
MLAWASTRNYEVTVLLDSEAGKTVQQVKTYVTSNSLLDNTNLAGIFWPHVLVQNPAPTVYSGETIVVPPSCFVAGRMARTDNEVNGGIYQASAGPVNGILRSASGLEILTGKTANESKRSANRAYAVSYRINPLSTHTGRGVTIEDNMTLKSSGDFNLLNQRRGVSYIERTISRGMEDFRFQPNTDKTRAAVDRSINKFLNSQLPLDAFSSRDPEEAFRVDTGPNVNTAAVIEAGILRVRIALSMVTPAKFIELVVTRKLS